MNEVIARVLSSPRLGRILASMALKSVAEELKLPQAGEALSAGDLNFALMNASALTNVNSEPAQDAVLRIAHAVLHDIDSTVEQRAAAFVLLERVGNRLAIDLAVDRYQIEGLDFGLIPRALAVDALKRRRELTIEVGANHKSIDVNPFQREFWDLVHLNEWVSVSAPTSAGKSHIVREWMVDEITGEREQRLVYLAPTRALVEEVGAHFRVVLGPTVGVHTLPWDPDIARYTRQVFVLTQERLHLLQERSPQFSPDVIFVDEAQKISEGTRGILVSQVIDEAVQRNPKIRLVFASPLSRNPGVLFGDHEPGRSVAALVGESVTVSQNLIYVKQKVRDAFTYEFVLRYNDVDHAAGAIVLDHKPIVGERVPFIAAAVGRLTMGNLVYANGPAVAEKYARLIYESLGPSADLANEDIKELIDFAKGTVHERFVLAEYARRGVAFHYGDMPLVLKAKVEELFKRGALRYLVCTSTLLEGVNLPCRNIFMRGPKKGNDHMSMADFWNLAGRAGRWGKEFQGNIFCIDVHDDKVWPDKPQRRERSEIVPAASRALNEVPAVLAYIADGGQMADSKQPAELESTFSWLSGRYLAHSDLKRLTGIFLSDDSRDQLQGAVAAAVSDLSIPDSLIKKHAGISPLSMQRLFDAVVAHGHPETMTLVPPTSDGAQYEYEKALKYVADFLGGSFAREMRRLQLAGLIVNWMSGKPLSRIIEGRAKSRRDRHKTFNYPTLIRETMSDVEDIARFEAPKYLSAYADIVSAAAVQLGRRLVNQVIDIEMMLELGVARRTEMSFIAAGLSRATCTEISSYVLNPDMTPAECIDWIRHIDVEALDVPAFAARELLSVRAVLAARVWS